MSPNLVDELSSLLLRYRSKNVAFVNRGISADIAIIVTDLTGENNKKLEEIVEKCFEIYFLKRLNDKKYSLVSDVYDFDISI